MQRRNETRPPMRRWPAYPTGGEYHPKKTRLRTWRDPRIDDWWIPQPNASIHHRYERTAFLGHQTIQRRCYLGSYSNLDAFKEAERMYITYILGPPPRRVEVEEAS